MMKRLLFCTLLLTLSGCCAGAHAQKDPDVGNVGMSPKKTLVENLENSPIHKTLVADATDAGVINTLNGKGPFTLFAPTDDAFARQPAGKQQAGTPDLSKVVTYHVVPGKLTSKKLGKMVKKGHGTAVLTTLEGGKLTVKKTGSIYTLTDDKGDTSVITTADVLGKGGVMHVVDAVLMPS